MQNEMILNEILYVMSKEKYKLGVVKNDVIKEVVKNLELKEESVADQLFESLIYKHRYIIEVNSDVLKYKIIAEGRQYIDEGGFIKEIKDKKCKKNIILISLLISILTLVICVLTYFKM